MISQEQQRSRAGIYGALVAVIVLLLYLGYKQDQQQRQLGIVVRVMRNQQGSITNLNNSIVRHNAALKFLVNQSKTNNNTTATNK